MGAARRSSHGFSVNRHLSPRRDVRRHREEESPAQRIARSLLALSKRLRLSDAELTGLAKLAGHVVELDVTCSIDIDAAGWSTVTYSHQLLNLTNRPIKRLTRELWFETTDGPLTIEPSPSNDRKV